MLNKIHVNLTDIDTDLSHIFMQNVNKFPDKIAKHQIKFIFPYLPNYLLKIKHFQSPYFRIDLQCARLRSEAAQL